MRAKIEWVRCASATKGGKPYFFNTILPDGRRASVAWDRFDGGWRMYHGCNYETASEELFPTPGECQRFAEEFLKGSKS